MTSRATDTTRKLTLPLLSSTVPETPATSPSWHGWVPLAVPQAVDTPEPLEPQGAYNAAAPEMPLHVPVVDEAGTQPVELLAPAGGPEAAIAAFHFGADAIYLGLKKFSARAE